MNKRIILFCLVALVTGRLAVRAGDTPAQAAARAALESKMKELDNPSGLPDAATTPLVGIAKSAAAASITKDSQPAKPVAPRLVPTATASPTRPAVVFLATNGTPARVLPPAANSASASPTVQVEAKPTRPLARSKPTNEIATIHGTVYKHAEVERVEPDGIIISYWTADGGLAMSKVYFEDLPADLRLRYQKK